jgi:hypothetical protein
MKQLLNKLQRNTRRHQKIQETDDDDTIERERVAKQGARKFIACLRLYFMQEGNEGSPTSALETCADFVQLQSTKRRWQGTLDQFLRH